MYMMDFLSADDPVTWRDHHVAVDRHVIEIKAERLTAQCGQIVTTSDANHRYVYNYRDTPNWIENHPPV